MKFNADSITYSIPWHKSKYPKPDDVVIAQVTNVSNMGIDVLILDYLSIDGYIALEELSKKRVYNLRSFIKPGDIKLLLVLRVDEHRGFVDLSNKYFNDTDEPCEDVVRVENYSKMVRLFHQWQLQIHNKGKPEFDTLIPHTVWRSVMEKTLWLDSVSDNYDKILSIANCSKTIQECFPLLSGEDLDILESLVFKNFKVQYELTIKIKLTTWSINSVGKIKSTIKPIIDLFHDYKTDVTISAPDYIIKLMSNNEKIRHLDVDTMCIPILDKMSDCHYNLEHSIVEIVS